MSFKAPISLIVIPAVVCCGFGCIKPEPARDIMSDDIIVGDSLIDSSDPDSVDWDTLLDGVVDVKPEDICGLVDADPVHVEGQPCEDEGESYCIGDGAYSELIPDFSRQCIRPQFVKCTQGSSEGQLTWQKSDCDEILTPMGQECGFPLIINNCIQTDKVATCCPWTAWTYSAGLGVPCSRNEIGQNRCGQGNYTKGGVLRTCNFLSQAQTIYPNDPADPNSGGPSSDKCDYIFAECPYWYYSELCPKLERCYHPTACESGTNEYGEPTNVCARACIYDTDQGVARCAKTCDDLFKYYLD